MTASDGVVLDRPGVTVLSTHELPWEPWPYLPGAKMKVLSRDEDGDPTIVARWEPPARAERARLSKVHHPAREFHFFLAGELPHWELDPDDCVHYRQGYWMDRLPGSPHGAGFPRAPSGNTMLLWMTATDDPFVGLDESSSLTTVLPPEKPETRNEPWPAWEPTREPEPPEALRVDRPDVRVLDTNQLGWRPHPALGGVRLKVLSARPNGDPAVTLVALPPGPFPVPALPIRVGQDFRELFYVLDGDLTIREYEGDDGEPIRLRAGYWVDRRPGHVHGYEPGDLSDTGCTLLHFRLRDGARLVKETEKADYLVVIDE